jgi:hypothetical protein
VRILTWLKELAARRMFVFVVVWLFVVVYLLIDSEYLDDLSWKLSNGICTTGRDRLQ